MRMKREFELRLDNLTAQLVTAEEVLNRKDNEITQLKNLMKDFEAFKAQVSATDGYDNSLHDFKHHNFVTRPLPQNPHAQCGAHSVRSILNI